MKSFGFWGSTVFSIERGQLLHTVKDPSDHFFGGADVLVLLQKSKTRTRLAQCCVSRASLRSARTAASLSVSIEEEHHGVIVSDEPDAGLNIPQAGVQVCIRRIHGSPRQIDVNNTILTFTRRTPAAGHKTRD